jgi:hypothetical protein
MDGDGGWGGVRGGARTGGSIVTGGDKSHSRLISAPQTHPSPDAILSSAHLETPLCAPRNANRLIRALHYG